MGEKFKLFYNGPYSQWYKANMYDPIYDMTFNCCEQYMMFCKAKLFKDSETAKQIMRETDPYNQKKLGRRVRNFDKTIWEKMCLTYVTRGNFLKFTQNVELLAIMFADIKAGYTTFVEASPRDRIWGIGLGENNPDCLDRSKWRGKNWLGLCLTNVKEKLMRELS